MGIRLDLAPDIFYVYIDGAIERLAIAAADSIKQLAACEHTPWVLGERREQLEFCRRQVERTSCSHDCHPGHIQREVANAKDLRVGPCSCSSEHCLDAGHELTRTEGLGDVVVRPDAKTSDPIRLLDSRGQHDDRDWRVGAK